MLVEAFRGRRDARDDHRQSLSSPITIESGLAAIRGRWPEFASPNSSEPVFILSAGWRSGSTLLQRWVMTDQRTVVWGEPYGHANLISSLAGQLKTFTDKWPQDDFFASDLPGSEDLSQVWVANWYPALADFMAAHIGYFERLFLEPARAAGLQRWGLKEVRLSVDDACYLHWLFPNAKFLFLYRNPYHAYSSYWRFRNWYRSWPDEPVFTATQFGAVWKGLAADFVANHDKVGGLLLRYEELQMPSTKLRLETYLGVSLPAATSLDRIRGKDAANRPPKQPHWIPKLERFLLKRQVEPVSVELGYPSA